MAFLDLSRRGDSGDLAGGVGEIAAVGDDGGGVVTAVRTTAGTLKLIHWQADPSGAVRRVGDSGDQAGAATSIALAKAGRHVSACRTGGGTLLLISWDVPSDGPVTRVADSGNQAGQISLVRLVALPDGMFVTACRQGDGTLKLITWRLDLDGSLHRLSDSGSAAGAVSDIALIDMSTTDGRVLTAVRAGDGSLKLILWGVSPTGAVTRLCDSGDEAGEATLIRAARTGTEQVVTSVRNGSGDLELIAWSVRRAGNAINREGDSGGQAGAISDNALLAFTDGVVSAVRAGDGRLLLISWEVTTAGAVTRRGDSGGQAGEASLIHLQPGTQATDRRGGSVTMITPLRNGSGHLELITWGPTCIGVHVKVLTDPTISIDTMFTSMRKVYETAGIRVNRLTTQTLDLPDLDDCDVGRCTLGSTTQEQDDLFGHRDDVGAGEIVVYFVRSLVPVMNGCASHPAGRPGAVVASIASEWTMGHEIGHVLGLLHCDSSGSCLLDRLMTGCGTANITNPPPDLILSEVDTMRGSSLAGACGGA